MGRVERDPERCPVCRVRTWGAKKGGEALRGPRVFGVKAPKEGLRVWEVEGEVRRVYWLSGMEGVHGRHALKEQETWMFGVSGEVEVELKDGRGEEERYRLVGGEGLYVPGGWWREARGIVEGSVLMCLASTEYDEGDYIREWGSFVEWAK